MDKTKLLIVVDMQNDFITGSLSNRQALFILDNVRHKIENWDGYIVYTMDTHDSDYLNSNEGKKLPVIHCIKDTPGWQLTEDIPYLPVIDNMYLKRIYLKNGFGSEELISDIRKLNENIGELKTIELIGLCTDICVACNAITLKGLFPELQIVVDASCTAGITPLSKMEALNTMKMCQIDIKEEEA